MSRPAKIAVVITLTVVFLLSCTLSSAYGRRIERASLAHTNVEWQAAGRSHQ